MAAPLPRAPRRHRLDEIPCECEPDERCTCVEKDEAAYDAEAESRLDRWREGDDDSQE